MAVAKKATISRWIGLSTDTKPTSVAVGCTFYEYDTKCTYTTYDGTNWTILALGYGLIFAGTCNSGMTASQVTVACADLAGYGNDYFSTQFYMQVVKNANSIGNAPDGEGRKISAYVSSTGTFTVDSFSANVQESDEIYVMHKSIMLILSELPDAGDWVLGDYDKFDIADADADNERWNPEYISGALGGSADINTTTAGKLMVKAAYNAAGAERYAVSHNLPFYADFLRITEDVSCTWGATDGATPKAVGIAFSAGTAWDGNNYIVIERQKGTAVNRLRARYSLNAAAEVTTDVTLTDDAIALKVERLDQTWALFYSTALLADGLPDWVKIREVEDPSNYMTDQVTYYQWAFNGSAGGSTETAQGDFDNFYYWLGTGGGSQYIAGDYDSSWVSPDIDGSVFERQEAIQKAINVTDAATLTGFEEDGTGANLFNTLIAVQSVTTGAGSTTTITDSGRTEGVDYWKGHLVYVLGSGADKQIRVIVVDDGAGTLTVRPAFIASIGATVPYVILKKFEFPVPATNGTENYNPRDVIGSKADVADYTYDVTTSSIVALVKGLLGARVIEEGTFTTGSATVPADTVLGAAYGTGYFNGQILVPLTGSVAFQPRLITGFTTTTGVFTIDADHPFTAATGQVAYIILANEADLVAAADGVTNTTEAHVVGNKADAAPAMNAAPADTDSAIKHLKALRETIGQEPADNDDSLHTSVGQRDAAATADDLSDITSTSMQAKLRRLLLRFSANAYSASVNPGAAAATDTETMIQDLANMLAGGDGVVTFPGAANIGNGVSLAEAIRAILTSLVGGDDYDAYTNINNTANASLNAALQNLAAVLGANAANVFNPTIQGAARTDADAALAALATYIAASGAALAIQVNGGTSRADLEQVLEDYFAVVGCDGANVFNPSIGGTAQTTFDAAFAALGGLMVNSGLAYYAVVDTIPLANQFTASELIGLGDGKFADATAPWYVFVLRDQGGLEAAPQGEQVAITTFTSVTGTVAHAAFSAALLAGDEVLILHPWIAAISGLVTELAKVPKSDAAVTWNATALQSIQDEAEDALEGEFLDHYLQLDGATQVYPENCVNDSILAKMLCKTDPASISGYNMTTDSQEALSDKMGTFSGDGGAAQDDSTKASLDLAHTDLDSLISELAKVPKSDAAVSWNGTALTAIEGEAQDAIQGEQLDHILAVTDGAGNFPNTAVDGSVVSKIISKVGGGDTSSYDETTDSLEMLSDKLGGFSGDGGAVQDDSVKASLDLAHTDIDLILADTGTDGVVVNTYTDAADRIAGKCQIKEVSITSAANAGDVTVATITTQPCQIESIIIHADAAQTAALTSCGIFGGASKVVTFIAAADAINANLDAADKQVGWEGAVRLLATKTIVISLVGTAATAVDLTIIIKFRATTDGGYLA